MVFMNILHYAFSYWYLTYIDFLLNIKKIKKNKQQLLFICHYVNSLNKYSQFKQTHLNCVRLKEKSYQWLPSHDLIYCNHCKKKSGRPQLDEFDTTFMSN